MRPDKGGESGVPAHRLWTSGCSPGRATGASRFGIFLVLLPYSFLDLFVLFCFLNKQAKRSDLVLEKLHLPSAEQRLGDDETRNGEARDTVAVICGTTQEALRGGQSNGTGERGDTHQSQERVQQD